jgi:hypothetical protein
MDPVLIALVQDPMVPILVPLVAAPDPLVIPVAPVVELEEIVTRSP